MGRDQRIEARQKPVKAPKALDAIGNPYVGSALRAQWEMDAEHAQLDAWLSVLRLMPECPDAVSVTAFETAQPCSVDAHIADCAHRLHALNTEVLDFMSEHFVRENTLMRRGNGIRGLRELFELHAEDHGTIMSSVVGVMELADPCRQRRALGRLLDTHYRRHLLTHDSLLSEQLPRLCHEPKLVDRAR